MSQNQPNNVTTKPKGPRLHLHRSALKVSTKGLMCGRPAAGSSFTTSVETFEKTDLPCRGCVEAKKRHDQSNARKMSKASKAEASHA